MHLQYLPEAFLFIGAGLGLIGTVLAVLTTIFVIWMLIDAITRPNLTGTEKLIWVLVILFLHFIGALIYYFVARGGTTRTGPTV